jgi:hypothetical protein
VSIAREHPTELRTSTRRRRLAARLFDGLILASCLLAPLVAALNAQAIFLQWRALDTLEAVLALAGIAVVAALLLDAAKRLRSLRFRVVAILAIAALPIATLAVTLLRSVPSRRALIVYANTPLVRVLAMVCLAAGLIAALAKPVWTQALIRAGRVVLAPVLMVTLLTFIRASAGEFSRATPAGLPVAPAGVTPPGHVLVLMFDELSFEQIYRGRDIAADLPHLARFGSSARHYFNARSPGGMTLDALAGYVALRRFRHIEVDDHALIDVQADGRREPVAFDAEGNLFARARAAGYRTELSGWYYPYCELLTTLLDGCEQYSFYNASTVRPGLSPLNAFRTTLILLPRQFPSGFLKSWAFADHQRLLTEQLYAAATRPFDDRPTFRFVHLSVPHAPFVFTGNGFDPPLDALAEDEERYRQQLVYVDGLIGAVVGQLQASGVSDKTTVVITSDHEWRAWTGRSRWPHVPLLVHRRSQAAREDEDAPVAAEDIIGSLAAHD